MKNNKKIFLGAGVLAIIYAAFKASSISRSISFFQYSITGLKFRVSNVLKPEIIFAVGIYNPNRVSVPVTSFFGTIKNGTTILASFSNDTPVVINGQQQSTIQVAARVNALTVVASLISKKKISSVFIDGVMKTGFFDLPIQQTVSLSTLSGTDAEIGMLRMAGGRRFNKPYSSFLDFQNKRTFQKLAY